MPQRIAAGTPRIASPGVPAGAAPGGARTGAPCVGPARGAPRVGPGRGAPRVVTPGAPTTAPSGPAPLAARTSILLRPLLLSLLLAACGGEGGSAPGAPAEGAPLVVPPPPPLAAEVRELYPTFRLEGLEERTFSPELWWDRVLPVIEGNPAFQVEEIGRSAEGRPLRHIAWGSGEIPVLMWSQMHGDESTASMALADILRLLAERPDHPLVAQLGERITLHLFPVMNPDGAARFQRRNAQGVDLNRDARALVTPEAQALKALRDRLEPVFGFNLHDQAVGTRAGRSDRGTAIALLAPPFNEGREVNEVRHRAMEVAALMRVAMEPAIGGHIAKWDDTFNPRAFGDLMTQWGTSTILVESGGWEGDREKQFLREMNVVGLLVALQAIADGSHAGVPVELYTSLPENGRRFGDLLLRGGTLVVPGLPSIRADVLVNFDHPLAERGGRVAEVGDLAEVEAREILDLEGLHLVALEATLERGPAGAGVAGVQIAPGAPAHFRVSRDPEGRDVVWEFRGDVVPAGSRP